MTFKILYYKGSLQNASLFPKLYTTVIDYVYTQNHFSQSSFQILLKSKKNLIKNKAIQISYNVTTHVVKQ